MEKGKADACPLCESVSQTITVMEQEHEVAGAAMEQLRKLTSDYTAPADGCNSFRALVDGLADFETDLHEHVHKENNILYPGAVRLEEG